MYQWSIEEVIEIASNLREDEIHDIRRTVFPVAIMIDSSQGAADVSRFVGGILVSSNDDVSNHRHHSSTKSIYWDTNGNNTPIEECSGTYLTKCPVHVTNEMASSPIRIGTPQWDAFWNVVGMLEI